MKMRLVYVLGLTAGGLFVLQEEASLRSAPPQPGLPAGAGAAAAAGGYKLVGWNNLGMHCMDADFSVFSILPPYNTIHAQLVENGVLVTSPGTITVTYQAVADPYGSINKTSQGKTNFWDHVLALYGAAPAVDMGLAGKGMPGPANQPQPMTFDAQQGWFIAEGIPIVPRDDGGNPNSYPMMRLVARDASGAVLATLDIVLPVSDEMDCRACHASGSGPAAQPEAGWANDADPQKDYRLNILRKHDDRFLGTAAYTAALAGAGYNPNGLSATVTQDLKPILCALCHASAALQTAGAAGVSPLTRAVHALHATVTDPTSGLTLDAADNRSACYRCHPGSTTKCLRGVMGSAVAPDGNLEIQCQSCHGSMSVVGAATRRGWLDEPNCQSCHTGDAMSNAGQIRFTSSFDGSGNPRLTANAIFATNANTPATGLSLYRFSRGHGGLYCEACHGSTHAEFPSSHRNDNIAAQEIQGHVGALAECAACHGGSPLTATGGPHGLHPTGQSWVNVHSDFAEGATTQCQACHGADYRGTVLSRVKDDRTVSTSFGTKSWWRGYQVGCYTCHNGPSSESQSPNRAPIVTNTTASTAPGTPVKIALGASDPNGDALTFRIVSQPSHGTAGLSGTQATYFPDATFAGQDSFTFAAWDGGMDSNLGTVAITSVAGGCAYALSHTSKVFSAAAGSDAVTLTAQGGCDWTASTSDAWITIQTGMAGSGNGTVDYSVAQNTTAVTRVGTLQIAGQTFTVTQGAVTGADLSGSWTNLITRCSGTGPKLKCRAQGRLMVSNGGTARAPTSLIRFYLSSDAQWDAGDTFLKQVATGALKAGQARAKKFNYTSKGTSLTGLWIIAVIDATGTVPETNEGNNMAAYGPLP